MPFVKYSTALQKLISLKTINLEFTVISGTIFHNPWICKFCLDAETLEWKHQVSIKEIKSVKAGLGIVQISHNQ